MVELRISVVVEFLEEGTGGVTSLCPGMTAGPGVTWCENQILRARLANSSNGSLVIRQHKTSRHIMRLVHKSKNNLGVILESLCKRAPESTKLSSGCCGGITRVADYGSGEWLGGGVVVTHVVVGVDDGVGGFVEGDVVDGIGVVGEVSFVEGGAQASSHGAHSLQEECYSEEIHLILVYIDINTGRANERVIHAESPR
jgi:hypothetical protein